MTWWRKSKATESSWYLLSRKTKSSSQWSRGKSIWCPMTGAPPSAKWPLSTNTCTTLQHIQATSWWRSPKTFQLWRKDSSTRWWLVPSFPLQRWARTRWVKWCHLLGKRSKWCKISTTFATTSQLESSSPRRCMTRRKLSSLKKTSKHCKCFSSNNSFIIITPSKKTTLVPRSPSRLRQGEQ